MVSFKFCTEILVQMVVCFNCLVVGTLDSSMAGQTLSVTMLSQKCRLGIKLYSFYFLSLPFRIKINSRKENIREEIWKCILCSAGKIVISLVKYL